MRADLFRKINPQIFPLRISLIYFLFASLWIFFSDQLVEQLSQDASLSSLLQTIKGIFFIIITSLLLYFMIRKDSSHIQQQSDLFKNIVDTSPVAITLIDKAGNIVLANHEAETLFNLSKVDITSRSYNSSPWKISAIDGSPFPENQLPFVIVKNSRTPVKNIEHAIENSNGEKKYLSINASPLLGKNKSFEGMIAAILDVTKQKQIDEQLRLKDELLEETGRIAKVGGWEFDPSTFQGSWTNEVARIHDLDPDQSTNVEIGIRFYLDDSKTKIEKAIKDAIELAKPYDLELEMVTAKGIRKWVRTIGKPVILDNKVVKIRGSFQDISEYKQTNQALQSAIDNYELIKRDQSELLKKLNEAQRSANIGSWDWNMINNQVWWSDQLYKIFELDPQIFIPGVETNAQYVHPDDNEPYHNRVKEILEKGGELDFDLRIIAGNGTLKYCNSKGSLEYDPDGKPVRFFGTFMDITSRKVIENSLIENEEKFRSIFESANVGKSITLPTGEINVNQAFCDMLGYTREELQNKKWHSITPEDEIPAIQKYTEPLLKGEKNSTRFEKRYICKNGSHIWSDVSISIRRDKNGKPLHFITTVIDITERKQVEEELQKSEEFLSVIYDSIDVGIFVVSVTKTGEFRYEGINPTHEKLLGLKNSQIAGRNTDDLIEYFGVESMNNVKALYRECVQQRKTIESEFFVPEGSAKGWWFSRLAPLFDAETGRVIRLIGTNIVITERKQAEAALRKSEELYRSLFKNMLNGFAYCQMLFEDGKPIDYIYLAINDAFVAQTGLKDVVGRKVTEIIPGIREADPQLFEVLGRVSMTGQPEQFEIFLEALQNWFILSVYSPAHEHFVAVFDVITERKQAEEKLKESESRFRKIYEDGANGMVMAGKDFKFRMANRTFCNMTGYSEDELKLLTFAQITHPDDMAKDILPAQKMMTGEIEVYRTEKRYLKKDGQVFWAQLTVSPVYDSLGQFLYFIGIIVDITERKKAEETLKLYHNQLEQLTMHLQTAREEERESIARDIHDDFGQVLTSLKMNLTFLKGNVSKHVDPNNNTDLINEINSMLTSIDSSVAKLRKLITTLRPEVLDKLGLIPALEWQTEEFSSNSQIKASFKTDLEEIHFNKNVEISVFRILQESLNNISKHSLANFVSVEFRKESNSYILKVTDNGIGINLDDKSKGTFGLIGMQERTKLIGGELTIDSIPGVGTTIKLILPFHDTDS